jgi:hypothetical protein
MHTLLGQTARTAHRQFLILSLDTNVHKHPHRPSVPTADRRPAILPLNESVLKPPKKPPLPPHIRDRDEPPFLRPLVPGQHMRNVVDAIIRQRRPPLFPWMKGELQDLIVLGKLDDKPLAPLINRKSIQLQKLADSLHDVCPTECLALEAQHRTHEPDAVDFVDGRPAGAATLFFEALDYLFFDVGAFEFCYDAVGGAVGGMFRVVPVGTHVRGVDVGDEAGCWGDLHVDAYAGAALPGADGGEVEQVEGIFWAGWWWVGGGVLVGASVVLGDPAVVEGSCCWTFGGGVGWRHCVVGCGCVVTLDGWCLWV